MINIVTIDPSLTSTALTVNGKPFSIASEKIALTKGGGLTKWFSIVQNHCEIITVNTDYGNEKKYSKLEINKLDTFNEIANNVTLAVDRHCNPSYNTVCIIEGYSYSSQAGPLIDLVTLGTLIREQMCSRQGTQLVVLSPSTVKKMAAKLTYEPIKKGKKIEYRNKQGVAGGSFKKHEIYKVLTENDKIKTNWIKLLKELEQDIINQKNIPKPIEDINDAIVMYHICEEEYKETKSFVKTIENLRTF